MKKTLIVLLMTLICTGVITGCNNDGSKTNTTSTPSNKAESAEAIPTLDEVISGTWSLYAGYDQSGSLVYASSESAEYSFTFNADNGFSGIYRQGDGYVNSTFTGVYDVTNSKIAYKNPYDWYYYSSIDKNSIADSGQSNLISKLGGEQGLHLIFKFRELDGQKLLYEEIQRVYFKK